MSYENDLFNRDFYPTPESVIEQMLALSDINGKHILEPSAGSGNIVDYCKAHGAKSVIACEINNKLRPILAQKCELIGSDFLQVTAEQISHIDLIVMNPPFSADEKHILHAWDIAPEGCEIVALCNSNTLFNTYSSARRELAEVIKLNGMSQDFDQAFQNAERKTDVRVYCIHLYKPRTGTHEFDGFFDIEEDEQESMNSGIVRYDYAQDLVSKYKDAVEQFDSVQEASKRINEVCESIGSKTIKFGAHRRNDNGHYDDSVINRDMFKKQLQKDAWQSLFRKFKMDKYVTDKVIQDLNRAIEITENMPFTVKNIYKLIQSLVGTHNDRMQQVLVEAFEHICSLSAENSTAGEKWKTNSDYMVNRRFIVPYITRYDTRWPNHYVQTGYGSRFNSNDVMKALCNLTGEDYNKMISLNSFIYEHNIPWGEWVDWVNVERDYQGNVIAKHGFFRIRGYKKGTMHFEFIDEDVWYKFNQAVAKIKGWQLPKQHKNAK